MINCDEIKIVLARLESMPSNVRLATESGMLGKHELMREVENETELGEWIVKAHMDYLRSFKKNSRFSD